jgi:hypothetical protein
MVLHLIPIEEADPLEHLRDEIRLLPTDTKPFPPRLDEWQGDTKEQIVTHVATGCRFHAYRLKPPLVHGLVLPFEHSYEIAVRFIGMRDNAELPAADRIKELGRQALVWISTFTFESSKQRV